MKVFILAGEQSGDKLGGALMAGLLSLRSVEFQGIGGTMMQAQGLKSLFDMHDLSVMGLLEVLPKASKLLRHVKQTVKAAQAFTPDVLITIDSPDFSLRVSRKLKKINPNLKVGNSAPGMLKASFKPFAISSELSDEPPDETISVAFLISGIR